MTDEVARAVLVELGVRMLNAQIRHYDASIDIAAAKEEGAALDDSVYDLSADEQRGCFLESCALLGVSPDHPALQPQRDAFEIRRRREHRESLFGSPQNAELN